MSVTLDDLARQMAELQTELKQVRAQLERADRDDEWLTAEEFETITHIPKRWLYDNADALPFVRRVNRKLLRVSRKGLIRWMETRRVA